MQPIHVDLRLFTDIGGAGLRLNPGRGLMARVMAADGTGRGVINIAGAVLEAQLPRHVRAGEQVRLVVRHLDEQRVVLELAHSEPGATPSAAAPQAPPASVALPDGGWLRVADGARERDDPDAPGRGGQSVALRYDAPALGALDLLLTLEPGALRVTVTVAGAATLAQAQAQAPTLRESLMQAGDRPVVVTVAQRRQPLDLYA